jgi:hypothetical protein
MFTPLYKFGKAYQDELLSQQKAGKRGNKRGLSTFSIRLQLQRYLGDALINLGERIKGEPECIDIKKVAYEQR